MSDADKPRARVSAKSRHCIRSRQILSNSGAKRQQHGKGSQIKLAKIVGDGEYTTTMTARPPKQVDIAPDPISELAEHDRVARSGQLWRGSKL
jgi:hypothetical protein